MHLTKAEIEDLKSRVDLVILVKDAGVALRRQGRNYVAPCPFPSHGEDRTPSFTVNPLAQLFSCFGACKGEAQGKGGLAGQCGGDVFTFVMKRFGMTFQQACEYLRERYGSAPRRALPAAKAVVSKGEGEYFRVTARALDLRLKCIERNHQELAINRAGSEWLESRGLVTRELWGRFRIGFSSGSLEDLAGTEASEARKLMQEIGYLDEDGHEVMKGRVVFPLLTLGQNPISVYGHAVRKGQLPKHLLPKGEATGERQGYFNPGAVGRGGGEVIIVESVACTVAAAEAGVFNVMPLLGCAEPSPELLEYFQRSGVKSVVVGLDSDETGRKSTPGVMETFWKAGFVVRPVEWPEKDPNDVLIRYGPEKTREIFDKLLAPVKPRDLPRNGNGSNGKGSHAPALPVPREIAVDDPEVVSISTPPLIEPLALVDDVPHGEAESAGAESASIREEDSAQAPPEPASTPPATPAPTSLTKSAKPTPEELRGDTLAVRYEDRRWTVSWLDGPSVAQLRATVRVELLPEAASEGESALLRFVDTLNLLACRNRDVFCRRALALLSPETLLLLPGREALARLLQQDLVSLCDLGETRRKLLAETPKVAQVLTPERRENGVLYLTAPDLLSRLAEDLDAMGYVGERKAKILGYLVAISRKLPQALCMVILSSSGSGKSALADVLEMLTPEEDLLVVTRFTANALYWMGPDALRRKFISIEERTGSSEADYALRALQSKGRVSQMAPVKDQATGKIESRLVMSEGPSSTLESTTEREINHENATRSFEQRLDESPEQTKRIQEAQRFSKTPAGRRAREKAERIAALHRDVQRCLRVVKVAIPWADLLEFPSTWTRNRRDNARFLNLIEVIAFLHQYQRVICDAATDEPCGRGLGELSDEELSLVYVEAEVADYAAATELYREILDDSLSEVKKHLREFFEVFGQMVSERKASGEEDAALLARELRERTRLPKHQVQRNLGELVELEYVAMARGVRGATGAYRLVEVDERQKTRMEGLLSVEDLSSRIAARKAGQGEVKR